MDKEDILTFLMTGFILFISYRIYLDSDYFQLKCIVSTVDGDKYCVRERDQLQPAADLLATTSKKMVDFVSYMKQHQPDDERTKRLGLMRLKLLRRCLPVNIRPTVRTKGKRLHFA